MTEIASIVLILLGTGFVLTAGIGLVKLPDALSRSHAISKALTLGLTSLLLALLFLAPSPVVASKILLLMLFQFITLPLAGHIFARYAIRKEL